MANVLEAVVSGVRALSTLEETSQHQQQIDDNQPQNDTAINVEAVLATTPSLEPPDVRYNIL